MALTPDDPLTSTQRPTFIVHLRPEPRVDAVRALRLALKTLLRRFGLRAISLEEKRRDAHPQ